MVQEQCCSSGQWVWANIHPEASTPISWSGRAVSHTALERSTHVSWILLPPYPSHCSQLLGRKQENPGSVCNSCHGCKGKGAWGELGSFELTAQASQQCHQQPRELWMAAAGPIPAPQLHGNDLLTTEKDQSPQTAPRVWQQSTKQDAKA